MPAGRAVDDGAVGELQPQVVAIAEHLHTGAMLVVVMERAPQGHVDQIGGPAVFVRDQVVDFAPGCGDVAIRPAAAAKSTMAFYQVWMVPELGANSRGGT